MFNKNVCDFMAKHPEFAEFMRKFEDNKAGLIYAAECSDLDISPECLRNFIEFKVEKIILPEKEGDDPKFLIRCAVRLRNHETASDASPYHAYVSVVSPHLYTWSEYGNTRSVYGREVTKQRLELLRPLLKKDGAENPIYKNWNKEHREIIKRRKLDAEMVFQTIREDICDIKTKVKMFEKVIA